MDYDFQVTLWKGIKGALFVLVGAFAAALVTPEALAGVQASISEAVASVPYVGGALAAVVASSAVAAVTGLSHAILNWLKNA